MRGGPAVALDVAQTVWGPVLDLGGRSVESLLSQLSSDAQPSPPAPQGPPRSPGEEPPGGRPGRLHVLAWTAHDPRAVNQKLFALEDARTVGQAIEVAHAAGIPPQNFTVADDRGHIGWTMIGLLPRRVGFDGRTPVSWADGSRRWDGWLQPAEVPEVIDPPSGRIWTANARVVGNPALARLGDGGYLSGARARQIRDRLLALERANPRDLLAIQLDDRALFLARWRALLLATLTPEATRGAALRSDLRELAANRWSGRASIDSAGYRAVREFRSEVERRVYTSLTGLLPPPGGAEHLRYTPLRQFEGPLWRLVTEHPPHLLDPRYREWSELLLDAADAVAARYGGNGGGGAGLEARSWGERNTSSIRHPLSRALPPPLSFLAPWLDMPPLQLPGDDSMPRVQDRSYGASERLVVSPGHEESGLFHMPTGQSGHPLSPHYGDGHAAWAEGRPTPFLPGPATAILQLVPGGSAL